MLSGDARVDWRTTLAALALSAAGAAVAQAQQGGCGTPYVIAPGDTLHRIATRAYGAEGDFRTLFAANRERLGWSDPSQIKVGQIVAIPCPDGAPPARIAVLARDTAPADAGPSPSAQIAAAALGEDALIARSPDIAAPPGALLGEGLYALSLPWARPDCAAPPDAQAARLCAEFLWSAPLRSRFEVLVTLVDARAPDAKDAAEICRPAFPPRPDAPDASACLDAVLAGDAEAARMEAGEFDALASRPAYADALREHPEWTREVSVHAIALPAEPGGAAAIARLDAGLRRLEMSGEAFALLSAALEAQAADQTP